MVEDFLARDFTDSRCFGWLGLGNSLDGEGLMQIDVHHIYQVVEAKLPNEKHSRMPVFGDVLAITGVVVKNRTPHLCLIIDTTLERPNFVDVSLFSAGKDLVMESHMQPCGQFITTEHDGTERVVHVFAGVKR